MKIAIDARMMGANNTRGIGRYIEELIRALLEISNDEFILVARTKDHPFANNPRVQTVVADISWYGWTEQFKMPGIFSKINADVYHVPHWNVSLGMPGPLVITVHDLLLRHQPNSSKVSTRSWPVRTLKHWSFRLILRNAISNAGKICVPTEFVKEDICKFYPSAKNKIVVTGEGISSLSKSVTAEWRPDWNFSKFLFYVGSAYPHKRLDMLLEAWPQLIKQYPDLSLVIAGEKDSFMKQIESKFKAQALPGVCFADRVTDGELESLYNEALALVFPSSFEGFGLVPLEALAHGCPVISSDSRPMSDTLGNKGVVFFKTGDVNDMIMAIKSVVDKPEPYRNQAEKNKSELLAGHDWKEAAKITRQAYQNCVVSRVRV